MEAFQNIQASVRVDHRAGCGENVQKNWSGFVVSDLPET